MHRKTLELGGTPYGSNERSQSPRYCAAEVIEISQTGFSGLRVHGVGEIRYALPDAQTTLGAAHIRSHSARRHEQKRSRIIGVAGGEAAHEHIERRLAATIDVIRAVLVVGDAALS